MKKRLLCSSIVLIMTISIFLVNGTVLADSSGAKIVDMYVTDNHRLYITFGSKIDKSKINKELIHLYYTPMTSLAEYGLETSFSYSSLKGVNFEEVGSNYIKWKYMKYPDDENFTVSTLSWGNNNLSPGYPPAPWGDKPQNFYIIFDEGAFGEGSPLQYVSLRGNISETRFGQVIPKGISDWLLTHPMPRPPVLKRPTKVSGLNVVSKKKKVAVVTWKKSKDAKGYEVYRSLKKNGGFKKITTISKLKYTDKKVKSKKIYYYKIKAFNKSGTVKNYGVFSTIKKIKVK